MTTQNTETKESNENYEIIQYFAITIDPLHVGDGGTRLGRVDNSIIRDPGTKIPKVPGSSLNGSARYYTALSLNKLHCAGKGGDDGNKHCGNSDCGVCIPFGFSNNTYSLQGLAHLFDAHIILFPVASMKGPIWVCSPNSLELISKQLEALPSNGFIPIGNELKKVPKLNFGWLLLKNDEGDNQNPVNSILNDTQIPKEIISRSVIVSDNLFSKIVNMNLEVRTSVSINPRTGAAEDGALFTFEAIPRATILKFDILYKSGVSFKINGTSLEIFTSSIVKENVEKGLSYFEYMGIGGMNTRGMGRMKVLNLDKSGGKT